ncbi:MAG TPA: ribonuclease HI family protein [Ktedonobacterales bacterium]|nr:ribonuclease HI family protein [Ktedonobacterales bacterium]
MTLTINVDGASRGNPGPSACAAVFYRDGVVVKQSARVIGSATNNEAEYRALLGALRYLPSIRQPGEVVEILSDSQLIVNQVIGVWNCNTSHLLPLCEEAQALIASQGAAQGRITLRWIPRAQNTAADALGNRVLDRQASA